MANSSPSRTILVAGIGVAVGSLLILNILMQRLDPKYQEQVEKEKQQQEAKEAADKQKGKTPPVASSAVPGGNDLVALGDDATVGKKDGTPKFTISYAWTPQVQADPGIVYKAVEQAQKMMPNASIRVVNSDAHPEMQPGIYLNGKLTTPALPTGGVDFNPQAIAPALGAAVPPPSGPPPGPPATKP